MLCVKRWLSVAAAAVLSTTVLSGCSTISVSPYPAYGDRTISISAIKEPFFVPTDNFTILPGYEGTPVPFSAPDSKLMIMGAGSVGTIGVGIMFGAIGGLIGATIQGEQNAGLVAGIPYAHVTARFETELQSALATHAAEFKSPKFSSAINDANAAVRLAPTGFLTVGNGGQTSLQFVVNAQFQHPNGQGRGAKIYRYFSATERPFSGPDGWVNEKQIHLKNETRTAMDLIARVILTDAAGTYNKTRQSTSPKLVNWRSPRASEQIRLAELERTTRHYVVSPIWSGAPVEHAVIILENGVGTVSD